jgi:hypothetical protein|tara:strand:+ start:124 stop:375 length:252 start_codon:yes stop_codon:yes gene_type:complete
MEFDQICAYCKLDPKKPFYSIQEAAQLLDKPHTTVWRWAARGIIETIRLTGTSYQKIPNSEMRKILTPTSEEMPEADEQAAAS